MITDSVLSRRIKQYRKINAMTQRELAEEIGVEPVHIANVERGRKGISLDKLVLICQCFHISLSDLLPIEECDDSDLRMKWTNEIIETLDSLDTAQLSIVRTMICSLADK